MTKGYKHLTAAQKAQILVVYAETNSTREAAHSAQASYHQVVYLLRMNSIHRSRTMPSACRRSFGLVLQMVQEGKSNSEIARAVGTTHHRVKDFLDRNHVVRPKWDNRMERNGRWRGGRVIDKDGYVLLKKPDHPNADRHGYVREHRLVMEAHLGRYLGRREVVHHLDQDKTNNALGNLKLYLANNEHLAQELKGKIPNWTPQGRERILKARHQPRGRPKKPTQSE